MKALKILAIVFAVALVAFIGIGIYVANNLNRMVADAIETFGPQYLGVPVTVGEVDLSLTEGSGSIRDLVIANPPEYEGPYAMRLDEIHVALDPEASSPQQLVLQQVRIDGAEVAAAVRGVSTKTNLQEILDNLEAASGPAEAEPEPQPEAEPGSVKVIIDRLDMVGAQASATSDLAGQVELTVPDIHLTDVGRDSNGATMAEVARQVLEPVTRAVVRDLARQGVGREQIEQRLEEEVEERLPGALEGLRQRSGQ